MNKLLIIIAVIAIALLLGNKLNLEGYDNATPLSLIKSPCGYHWKNNFYTPIVQVYGGTYFTDDYFSISHPGNYNLNNPNNYSEQFKSLSGRVSSIKVAPGNTVELVDPNGDTISFKDSVNDLGHFEWNNKTIAINVYHY